MSTICRRVRRRPEKVVDFRSAIRGSMGDSPSCSETAYESPGACQGPRAKGSVRAPKRSFIATGYRQRDNRLRIDTTVRMPLHAPPPPPRASFPESNSFWIRLDKAAADRLLRHWAFAVDQAKQGDRQASPFPGNRDHSPRRRIRWAPMPTLGTSTPVSTVWPPSACRLTPWSCLGPRELAHD